MKADFSKKVTKLLWDISEISKDKTMQNIIAAAKKNDIKITHEDLQKLNYIVSSTIEQVCIDASKNFENNVGEMVTEMTNTKSGKAK